MTLKLKYRTLNEPRSWLNRAGHKNMQKGRGKPGGNSAKRSVPKGTPHVIGMSGRTLALKKIR